ncbi:MAG TPA: DNA methyltransferase [Chloroflexota bacterium]
MALDLDFAGQKTAYASHGLHSFAAKFPPQLAGWGIERYSRPGETVLDPMAGSGTTLVEARLLGRDALGADIDPLARLIARVKATPLQPELLEAATSALLADVESDFAELRRARAHAIPFRDAFRDVPIPEFPNRDYWFLPQISEELALLRRRIDAVEPHPEGTRLREFFYVVFSALIITKSSTSVANVRDLAHSRPHRVEPRQKPNVPRAFQQRLARLQRGILDFGRRCDPSTSLRIVGDDARRLPLEDESVDLVFTSPPYVNAIDYPRAHKFSLHWLGDALGVTPEAYRALGRAYIGTDRVPIAECLALARAPLAEVSRLEETLGRLADSEAAGRRGGPRRAGVVRRYFDDMAAVLTEVGRVLRPGRHAVVVVCPSQIAGVPVETHALLADLAEARTGGRLRHVETYARTLDDAKRQLPIVRGRFGTGMRTEYVVVLQKTA